MPLIPLKQCIGEERKEDSTPVIFIYKLECEHPFINKVGFQARCRLSVTFSRLPLPLEELSRVCRVVINILTALKGSVRSDKP